MSKNLAVLCAAALVIGVAMHPVAGAESPPPAKDAIYFPSATGQTEDDTYTRYELLAPESNSFRIYYEVTATTAGAKYYYNPIRKGSTASEESATDAMLGTPLHFEVVSGAEARKDALMVDADLGTNYIKVTLARPVPVHGQARIVILKTYKDAKSYHLDGNAIVFNRPLGVQRNKIVLPPGYEVVGLTVPSQIRTEKDGRLAVSFLHAGAGEAPLELRAVKDAQLGPAALPKAPSSAGGSSASTPRRTSAPSSTAARASSTSCLRRARRMSHGSQPSQV